MITPFLLDATLALIAADPALLDGASMGLFTNYPDVFDPDLVLADLTAANFTTYAPAVIVAAGWLPAVSADGVPYLVASPKTFQPSNAVNLPQVVNGAYYFNGANLLRVAYFAAPVALVESLQMMHATPAIALGQGDPIPQEGATS